MKRTKKQNTPSAMEGMLGRTGALELTKVEGSIEHRNNSKRSEEQREADLALISNLLIRENLTNIEIAQKISEARPYSISNVMVGYDIKELQKRWREAYLSDIDTLKGRELRRIDELESAYWDSYQRSLGESRVFKEDVTEFSTEDKIGMDDSVAEEAGRRKRLVSNKTTSRDGEVRFLNGIQWCINKRCEILGLNAPIKSEMTFDWRTEAEKQGIDPGTMFNDLVKKFVDGKIVDSDN